MSFDVLLLVLQAFFSQVFAVVDRRIIQHYERGAEKYAAYDIAYPMHARKYPADYRNCHHYDG